MFSVFDVTPRAPVRKLAELTSWPCHPTLVRGSHE
jgi:hypothetical protein